MALARVGSSIGSTTTATGTTGISLARTAGAGNLLIVSAYFSDVTSAITISDTQGNTWNVANPDFTDGTLTRLASWYAIAKNGLSTTVTVKDLSPSSNFMGITIDEFSGNHATPLDQVNHSLVGATYSAGSVTSPSITLGAADCVLWSLIVDSASGPSLFDGTNGTVGFDDTTGDETGFRVLTGRSGAAVTVAWSGSGGTYEMFVASFKPAAGGAAVQVPFQPQYHRAPIMAQ